MVPYRVVMGTFQGLKKTKQFRSYFEILGTIIIQNTASLESINVPYFFGYKMASFIFQSNPKDLDPPYKMDLDFWDYFRRENPI